MSKHAKYEPRHRHAPGPTLTATPRRILRSTVVMSSVAVAATGVAVSGGVLSSPAGISAAAEDLGSNVTGSLSGGQVADREPVVSRGSISRTSADRRDTADPAKEAALAVDGGRAVTRSVDVADGDPRDIARALMPQFGFGADQFGCLDALWTRESNWSPSAHNASSGAHGIPQALPGSKMASAGPDWVSDPVTQITWGLGYIQDRYGSPCGAWGHSQSVGWY